MRIAFKSYQRIDRLSSLSAFTNDTSQLDKKADDALAQVAVAMKKATSLDGDATAPVTKKALAEFKIEVNLK
jgi:hypothetical protein